LTEPVVFCIYPPELTAREEDLDFITRTQQLERDDQRDRRWEFQLSTTGFWNHRQFPVTPHARVLTEQELELLPVNRRTAYGVLSIEERQQLTAMPAGLGGLAELASKKLEGTSLLPSDRMGRATLLEQYLRDSGEFVYSLRGVERDSGVDPVEDFVLTHKQGHCEYFASALALMLRSQGIPSRIVVGFKGGDFNSYDNVYSVRQLHAHTWVEAYLEPEQLPLWPPGHPDSGYTGGGWLRLDPTPGVDESGAPRLGRSWFAGTRELAEYLQRLWANYVVGLTPERQRTAIYGPFLRIRETLNWLLDRETWKEWLKWVNWESIRNRNWFSWRGGLVAMALSLIVVGLYRVAAMVFKRLRHWIMKRRQAAQPRGDTAVEFYRRFEQMAARRGLSRRVPQTAHEFAEEVAGHLAAHEFGPQVVELPPRLAQCFYQVRFGLNSLDTAQVAQVEGDLSALERAFLAGEKSSAPHSS
jgi:hypothetical protein